MRRRVSRSNYASEKRAFRQVEPLEARLLLSAVATSQFAMFAVDITQAGTYSVDVFQSAQTFASNSVTDLTLGDASMPVMVHLAGSAVNSSGQTLAATWTLNLSPGRAIVRVNSAYFVSTAPVRVPTAATNLQLTIQSPTAIGLQWADNSYNETGFAVQRQAAGGSWSLVTTTAPNATSFLDSTAQVGTQYYYRVLALNDAGPAPASNSAGATTPSPPNAPSNLNLTVLSSTSIQLGWNDNSTDETGFIVQRQDPGSSNWNVVTTTGANITSYTDQDRQPNTQYSYRVLAISDVGASGSSNVAAGTTQDVLPVAPSNLTLTVQSSNAVGLTWRDNSNNETGFLVERQDSGSSNWNLVTTTAANATNFTDTTAQPSSQYSYRVLAKGSVGYSAESNTATATTDMSIMGMPEDANGFTQLTPTADTTFIYISSSQGSDSNSGLTSSAPIQSLAKAEQMTFTRQNHPIWVLLKRGDTFTGTLNVSIAGTSVSAMSIVGAYGTGDRPIVTGGILLKAAAVAGWSADNVAVMGINCDCVTSDPSSPSFSGSSSKTSGLTLLGPGNNILIEDCVFQYFQNGLNIQYANSTPGFSLTNLVIRRNIVVNNYNTIGHSQGLFADGVHGLLIEDNVLDHNGWIGSVSDRDHPSVTGGDPTIFNHNIYIQYSCASVTLLRNISANASSHGAQLRPGGTAEDNLFLDDPISLLVGSASTNKYPTAASTVTGNMILEGNNIDSINPRGLGLDINQSIASALVDNNVIAHGQGPLQAISIDSPASGVTLSNNTIYQWAGNKAIANGGTGTIQTNNTVDGTGYANPNLTLGDYNASLGGTNSEAAFLAACESRAAGTWNAAYGAVSAINFIRAGFGLAPE